MAKIIQFAIVSLLLSTSCAEHKFISRRAFPQEMNLLPSHQIVTDVFTSYNVSSIKEIGTYRILKLAGDYAFAITDSEFNLVQKVGRLGNGPGEFLYPVCAGGEVCSDGRLYIDVLDIPKGKYSRIYADIVDMCYSVEDLLSLPNNTRSFYDLLDGRRLICGNNNRYYYQNLNNTINYLEGWGENINHAIEHQEWFVPDIVSFDAISADSTCLLICDSNSSHLWLHNLSDGSIIKELFILDNERKTTAATYWGGYYDASFCGDNIVILYNVSEDLGETIQSYLMIFDKNVEPKCLFTIPNENISFSVNQATGELAVIGSDYEGTHIYDLSEWLL